MIRMATAEDAIRICKTRGDIVTADNVRYDMCVICETGKAEMLFYMMRVGDSVEVHVYCPLKFMRYFRSMVNEYFEECKKYGIKRLVTATDKTKKIDGTVLKLGFKLISEYNDINVYERFI